MLSHKSMPRRRYWCCGYLGRRPHFAPRQNRLEAVIACKLGCEGIVSKLLALATTMAEGGRVPLVRTMGIMEVVGIGERQAAS
jgi:hypothetical protein